MRPSRAAWGVAATSMVLRSAWATVRMPEEFNVEKDFGEKERWKKMQPYIRCDICEMTVGRTFDTVGESTNEDEIYDYMEKICDVPDLYDKYEFVEAPSPHLEKVTAESNRTAHAARWQTHAMKELCDNIIRPADDEIKDFFFKSRRGKKKHSGSDEANRRATIVRGACEKLRLCYKGKPREVEL